MSKPDTRTSPARKRRIVVVKRCTPGTPRSTVEWRDVRGNLICVSFVPDWQREFDREFIEWVTVNDSMKTAKLKEYISDGDTKIHIVTAVLRFIDKKISEQIRIRRKHYRPAA